MSEFGKYIVIEGQDATGKSTQARLLRDHLARVGIDSIEFHEPQDETIPITSKLRDIIKDQSLDRNPTTNLLLFTAARNEIWTARAQQALKLGKWVVASRNFYSTLAYQGYGEGLDLELIRTVTETVLGGDYMHPDFAAILSLENENERQRRLAKRSALSSPDTFESRDEMFQQRVSDGYLKIAASYDLPVLSAEQLSDDIAEEIRALIAKKGLWPDTRV